MDTLLEFAAANWLLVAALVAVIIALIANEIVLLRSGRQAVDPGSATRLYNQEDAVFIDLRSENAYHKAHLPSAVNIPEAHLDTQSDRLERYQGRPAVVYADAGRGLAKVLPRIEQAGLTPVYQLRGGIQSWQEANLPTEGRG